MLHKFWKTIICTEVIPPKNTFKGNFTAITRTSSLIPTEFNEDVTKPVFSNSTSDGIVLSNYLGIIWSIIRLSLDNNLYPSFIFLT